MLPVGRMHRVYRMRNPWLLTFDKPRRPRRVLPNKGRAIEAALAWVADHPRAEVGLRHRKRRSRAATIRTCVSPQMASPRAGISYLLSGKPTIVFANRAGERARPQTMVEKIERDLMQLGHTARQAKYFRKVVFDVLKGALTDHRSVELPMGTLAVVPSPEVRLRYTRLPRPGAHKVRIERVFTNESDSDRKRTSSPRNRSRRRSESNWCQMQSAGSGLRRGITTRTLSESLWLQSKCLPGENTHTSPSRPCTAAARIAATHRIGSSPRVRPSVCSQPCAARSSPPRT